MVNYLKRSWAEINLDSLSENIRRIQSILSPGCGIMGIIKADAYGHGDKYAAQCLRDNGVTWFGVSNLEEALSLRRQGFDEEILILGFTPPDQAQALSESHITQAVFSPAYAQALSGCASRAGVTVETHIKLDTGMGRIGFQALDAPREAAGQIKSACRLPGLHADGIFTHFASADELDSDARDYTRKQFACFMDTLSILEAGGIHFSKRHCCNSAALLQYPEMHLDLVRPGVILYGLYPSGDCRADPKIPLKPVMSLKSAVSMVKEIGAGHCVSYGRTYVAEAPARVATIPIGYADGYPRSLSNRAHVLIKGRPAPVVGRVCMDQLIADVTGIPDVGEGDIATLFGQDGAETLPVDELASLAGTIHYELVCLVGKRVPRIYLQGGKEIAVVDYIRSST